MFALNLKKEKIAIVGSGQMGRSWAMLFSSANYQVNLYDIDPNQVVRAKYDIKAQLEDLEKRKLLRGSRSARDQNSIIAVTHCLAECVKNVSYIQESITENLTEKKKLFLEIDKITDDNVIVASSTSTFLASALFSDVKHKKRFIITHAVHPPYSIPLVEIVPGDWTDEKTLNKTKEMLKEIGQSPVVLKKENIGFAANRIQFAMIGECWQLLNEGIIDIEDIDKVVSEGIAMKYAILGPFAQIHLSADGVKDYFKKFRPAIANLSETFKPCPRFEGVLLEQLTEYLNKKMPLDELGNHRKHRNKCLLELWNLKKTISDEEKETDSKKRKQKL